MERPGTNNTRSSKHAQPLGRRRRSKKQGKGDMPVVESTELLEHDAVIVVSLVVDHESTDQRGLKKKSA